MPSFDLVVVVTSFGGLSAISTLLAALPDGFPVPVLVHQHGPRSDESSRRLVDLLRRRTTLAVRAAEAGVAVGEPGVSVLAGGRSAELTGHRFDLRDTEGVGGADLLLSSAAAAYGRRAIGVVLTGLLRDGAVGARAIKRHGGRVLAEDPSTARGADMPRATIATGCVDFVLPVQRMAPAIVALTLAPGGADMLAVPTPAWAQLDA